MSFLAPTNLTVLSNIGNARIDGLADQLKLDGTKFNVALCVFYIPYIIVDVPSNWLLKV